MASTFCLAQTSFDVKEVEGKTIVVQNTTSEVAITSAEIDKQITELDKQIKLLTEQKNVFLDLYRKVRAIEEKNKPGPSKEAPKN